MRVTDASFSSSEATLIRRLMSIPGAQFLCPRCSSPLAAAESGLGLGRIEFQCRLIRCAECRRMITVSDAA